MSAQDITQAEPVRAPESKWVEWLDHSPSQKVYSLGGESWWLYRNALIPAEITPHIFTIDENEVRELLSRSGAWFLRYVSKTCTDPTEFWWVECVQYQPNMLSKNTRNQIRRAYKECAVQRVTNEFMLTNGYPCYLAAFARYGDAKPFSEEEFTEELRSQADGPFERWGVFVGNNLAGFANCAVEKSYIGLMSMKLHPAFLKSYPAYALLDTLLGNYVRDDGKCVTNGYRSINHETQMQDFLRKFGFVRRYCDLKVVYSPKVALLVRAAYPFRKALKYLLPPSYSGKAQALLMQEDLRRSFMGENGS